MELVKTLEALCAAFGPSGQEKETAQVIEDLAKPYADEITRDVMGNLIVHKKGSGPKVMFAAHMDSLGLMVTHITDEGFLRVGKIGGVSPKDVLGTPVRFQNGVRGTVYEDDGLGDAKREIGHLFVDIGANNANQAKERVQVGDVAVYATPTYASGHALISPYLDNRVCCLALLRAMELVGESGNDLYFVFTTQEEVGLRGARTAAWRVEPEVGVAVDVTDVDDTPGSEKSGTTQLGKGAAVKVMDSSVICHPEIVARLEELAKAGNIPVQRDILRGGGTDAGAIHTTRLGVKTGGISIPCRYIHTPAETVCLPDAEACAGLAVAFAQQ